MSPGGSVARSVRWGRRIVPPAEGSALAVLLSVIYLFPGESPPSLLAVKASRRLRVRENRPTAV